MNPIWHYALFDIRQYFTQNSEIDQINNLWKANRFRERNPESKAIMKWKFCFGKFSTSSCQALDKNCIVGKTGVILLNVALKSKTSID